MGEGREQIVDKEECDMFRQVGLAEEGPHTTIHEEKIAFETFRCAGPYY